MVSLKTFKQHTNKALDYLGKKLNLDIHYFVRGGFWLLFGYFFNVILSLLIVIAFTRLTSKELYGQYQFIIALVSTLAIFSLPGMHSAIIQSVARGREAALIQGTKARFRWSLIGTLAFILVSLYFKFIRPKDFWFIFLIVAGFFPFLYSFDTYSAYFFGKRRFDKASIYGIVRNVFVGLAILLAIYFTRKLSWIVLAFLSVTVISCVFIYSRVKSKGLKGKDPNVVHYGWHLSLMESLPIVANHFDKLILPLFLGLENLAIYAVALALPEGVKGILKLSGSLLLPKFSTLKGKVYANIKGKLIITMIISILFAIIGVILTPIFIPLLFSSTYAISIPFAQILFVSIALILPNYVFVSLLQARKKVSSLYKYQVTFAVVSVLSLLILIPKFGILGACFAKLISRFVGVSQLWFEIKTS